MVSASFAIRPAKMATRGSLSVAQNSGEASVHPGVRIEIALRTADGHLLASRMSATAGSSRSAFMALIRARLACDEAACLLGAFDVPAASCYWERLLRIETQLWLVWQAVEPCE